MAGQGEGARDDEAEIEIEIDDAIERARRVIRSASRVLILTGAGVSAESGVPTFRGAHEAGAATAAAGGGEAPLWTRFRPEDLATPRAFARDPRLVWSWYGWRRELVARCRPNAAHHAIARYLGRNAEALLVTQNVDGLHALAASEASAAGAPPIELHGNLYALRCSRCPQVWEDREPIDASSEAALPRCPGCAELARPHIVWFGEPLPEDALAAAFAAAERAEVCLVVGTSAVVHPAASVAWVALERGARLIEVNPDPSPLTGHAHVTVAAGAGHAVPAILDGDHAC